MKQPASRQEAPRAKSPMKCDIVPGRLCMPGSIPVETAALLAIGLIDGAVGGHRSSRHYRDPFFAIADAGAFATMSQNGGVGRRLAPRPQTPKNTP